MFCYCKYPHETEMIPTDFLRARVDVCTLFIYVLCVSDPLSESARSIRIDKDFAKILYTKWRKSVQV